MGAEVLSVGAGDAEVGAASEGIADIVALFGEPGYIVGSTGWQMKIGAPDPPLWPPVGTA